MQTNTDFWRKMGGTGDNGELFTNTESFYMKDRKKTKTTCCSKLKMFIVALSFAYFSKALSGTYMKSSITQIERRFDLPSYFIGFIDGSFEMGNLMFLVVVSHFGAKLHRPQLIGAGCVLMAIGSVLTGLPHFFMGPYKYETVIQDGENSSISPCLPYQNQSLTLEMSEEMPSDVSAGCRADTESSMWVYVLFGNVLRGIGETPVTPLGISYIDDFAKAENSAFYIACLHTITLFGPMFGFLLGSLCARLYVDIGYVDLESVTITPKDARWVGAWWLGFFVSSAIMLFAGIPFWFLPKSLRKQGEEEAEGQQDKSPEKAECLQPLPTDSGPQTQPPHTGPQSMHIATIAKGLFPSLKKLLGTPAYFVLLCGSILRFNSFIGLVTFKSKYMEQQFGQSASRANFLIGIVNLPSVATGIFLGGLIMKRYKLNVVAGAQLSLATSLLAYIFLLAQLGVTCENSNVAGLTVSYTGDRQISFDDRMLMTDCNRGCSCSLKQWDPVCADNGITYMTPCLAGCETSSGFGKNTVFHNCSCVASSPPLSGNLSVILGQCPRKEDCSRNFMIYMVVSVLGTFINSLGMTPGYMIVIRCIKPELKSLGLGIQTMMMRTLGGIPAAVYFGALIDSTCLKWGTKRCGSRGACRLYDSDVYRYIFFGLITSLTGSSFFFTIGVIVLLRKQLRKEGEKILNGQTEMEFVSMNKEMLSHENKLSDCLCKDGEMKE
ncbi:solute carrier organic anion transporter family member 1C1 [Amia ocellicauda]|uniref:solute carrier organic anion transporter family member 1C1 n=1 Tax=Amia ocellicauda TaxID=2972642 RepID=UPI00346400B0